MILVSNLIDAAVRYLATTLGVIALLSPFEIGFRLGTIVVSRYRRNQTGCRAGWIPYPCSDQCKHSIEHHSLLFFVTSEIKLFKTDRMRLKANAHQNPSTSKPGVIVSTNSMINALITSRNSPNVKRVIGIVKITRSGFTMAFTTESITATSSA